MVPTHCPACDVPSLTSRKDWPLETAAAYACNTCGLLFSWPQPGPSDLSQQYGPSGQWHAKHTARAQMNAAMTMQPKTKGKAGRALLARVEAMLEPGSRRVLDFGCGIGAWLNAFAQAGWETWGIEPASDLAFVRHQRLHTIPSDGRFDCVMAYHVLEHLPRPLDTLRQFVTALRPGGLCVLSVPRLDRVDIHQDRSYCLDGRTHIVAFTEACLRDLCGRAGFRDVIDAHDMDALFTHGRPVRLRLIARRS